jgi:hypothetical protein
VSEPSLRAQELVGQLWNDVRLRDEAGAAPAVPDLGATARMIHDPDLLYLNSRGDGDPADVLTHVVAVLNSLAERRDELAAELRLLREAIVTEASRLAERDDVLHRMVEGRLDRLEGGTVERGTVGRGTAGPG